MLRLLRTPPQDGGSPSPWDSVPPRRQPFPRRDGTIWIATSPTLAHRRSPANNGALLAARILRPDADSTAPAPCASALECATLLRLSRARCLVATHPGRQPSRCEPPVKVAAPGRHTAAGPSIPPPHRLGTLALTLQAWQSSATPVRKGRGSTRAAAACTWPKT